MAMETKDKRPTAGNLKAFWNWKFSNKDWLKKLRGRMGLGETLGPLPEENGGTGSESTSSVFDQIVYDFTPHMKTVSVPSGSTSESDTRNFITYWRDDGTYIRFCVDSVSFRTVSYVDVMNGSTLKSGKSFTTSATFSTRTDRNYSPNVKAWNCVEYEDGSAKLFLLVGEYYNGLIGVKAVTASITSDGALSVSVGADLASTFSGKVVAPRYNAFTEDGSTAFVYGSPSYDEQYIVLASQEGSFSVEPLSGDDLVRADSKPKYSSDGKHMLIRGSTSDEYSLVDFAERKVSNITSGSFPNGDVLVFLDDATKLLSVGHRDRTGNTLAIGRINAESGSVDVESGFELTILSDENWKASYKYFTPIFKNGCMCVMCGSSYGGSDFNVGCINERTKTFASTTIKGGSFELSSYGTTKRGNVVFEDNGEKMGTSSDTCRIYTINL